MQDLYHQQYIATQRLQLPQEPNPRSKHPLKPHFLNMLTIEASFDYGDYSLGFRSVPLLPLYPEAPFQLPASEAFWKAPACQLSELPLEMFSVGTHVCPPQSHPGREAESCTLRAVGFMVVRVWD